MDEIFEIKKNLGLITLEGIREFANTGTPFSYRFELVAFSERGIPQYTMFVHQGGREHVLVARRVGVDGPTIRKLNLFPAVVSIHQEFGGEKKLEVQVSKHSLPPQHSGD